MSDPSLPLQKAIVDLLKADAGVSALVHGRVYDHVAPDAQFPYITVGDNEVLPDKADCIDGTEISLQVDAWSRATGYPECKNISAAVIEALDDEPGDLTVAGYNVTICELAAARYLRDPDGLTRHGAITFRVLLEQL